MGRSGNMSEVLARREFVVARVGSGDRWVERWGESVLRYDRAFPVVGRGELVDSHWIPDEVVSYLTSVVLVFSFTRAKFRDSHYNSIVYYRGERGRTLRKIIVKLKCA